MTESQMIAAALEEGFLKAALVDTAQIVFDPSFRPYCEANLCGQYGANYSCPPDCGSPEEMKQKLLRYKRALVVQTLWDIEDYFDTEAIIHAKGGHNTAQMRLIDRLRSEGCDGLMCGASCCTLCSPCKARTGESCSHPERQFSCLSAYCIFVKDLAEKCDMQYDCGKGKVAFFGLYAF